MTAHTKAARLGEFLLHQASSVPTGLLARNSSEESDSGNFSAPLWNPGLAEERSERPDVAQACRPSSQEAGLPNSLPPHKPKCQGRNYRTSHPFVPERLDFFMVSVSIGEGSYPACGNVFPARSGGL